jgi:alkanesulfonate monooxygenase SsuD/methylene tetrahydromethanopterin reductase-like flavin-dependent oxidoreductase (luciferase family)
VTVKIGVLLPASIDDAGDYLADARALDAAGVDSLWLPDEGLDAWLLLASIAAVTGGARLVAPVRAEDVAAPEALARRIGTLDRLSRGRLLLTLPTTGPVPAVEAAIGCVRRCGPHPLYLRSTGDGLAVAARLTDGLLVGGEAPGESLAQIAAARTQRPEDPFEIWARIPRPEGRADWRRLIQAGTEAGATGVLVPADARLLDLLRNGDEQDDRSDLALAQG